MQRGAGHTNSGSRDRYSNRSSYFDTHAQAECNLCPHRCSSNSHSSSRRSHTHTEGDDRPDGHCGPYARPDADTHIDWLAASDKTTDVEIDTCLS